jgi:SARP family transcriptional regulator, regulator of embCAB operon
VACRTVFCGMKRPVDTHAERSHAWSTSALRISVLGRFTVVDGSGAPIPVANGTQRLLSLLALRDRVVHRASVAGALWPDVSESHAHASLRSALLRIPNAARSVVAVSDAELSLADGVDVDVREARALAHRLLDETAPLGDVDVSAVAVSRLASDLLPGWRDEWVTPEAEEWRQLRLHALEALTDRLAAQTRYGDAMTAAMAAIKAEPLRESAHAALIRVHLAESNQSEALRQFARYQQLLRAELGIEPTSRLRELIGSSARF